MDNDFITRIYNEYYGTVKMVVTSLIYSKNQDDITSCVHDVYLIAMKKEGLEAHPSIDGWLYLTAKNVVNRFNHRYLTSKNRSCNLEDVTLVEDDFSAQLAEDVDYQEIVKRSQVRDILAKLTDMERDFYDLRYRQKLSSREIGEALGISEGAVVMRNARLKTKIKKILRTMIEGKD